MSDPLSTALTVAESLVRIAGAVMSAVRRKDVERVNEILSDSLQTTTAKAVADIAARERFAGVASESSKRAEDELT